MISGTVDKGARRYVTPAEFERLHKAARAHSARDAAMILLAYRHGLRSAELVALQWSDVDLAAGTLYVRRVKHGTPAAHPLQGDELRALRALQREASGPHVFTGQRGPLTTRGFRSICANIAKLAGVPLNAHALRHGCGYKLANDGHDTRALQAYLGHRNIQSTVRYTDMAPNRFRDFWR